MMADSTSYILPLYTLDRGLSELNGDIDYLQKCLLDIEEEHMTANSVLAICLAIAAHAAQREYLTVGLAECFITEDGESLLLSREQTETFAILNEDVNYARDMLSSIGFSLEIN